MTTSTPGSDQPFFRYDLETSIVEQGGQRFVDVADPQTGKEYRFYEVEYAVACGMDGTRDVSSLCSWAAEELGLQTSPLELRGVVATLSRLGYLSASEPGLLEVEEAVDASEFDEEHTQIDADLAPSLSETIAGGASSTQRSIDVVAPLMAEEEPYDTGVPDLLSAAPGGDNGDFALGSPGKSPLLPRDLSHQVEVEDIELGGPGRSPLTPERPMESIEDVVLGAAGGTSEVTGLSTDLSALVNVDTQDVHEAIRHSKSMEVVVADAVPENEPAPDLDGGRVPLTTESVTGIMPKPEVAPPLGAPAEQELPPRVVPSPSRTVPAERNKGLLRPLLLGILLAALGAAAAYLYRGFVAKSELPIEVSKPTAVAAPEFAQGVLLAAEPTSHPATTVAAGTIAFIVEGGSKVKEGDTVARLGGTRVIDGELLRARESQQRYQLRLEAARANNDQAAAAKAATDVERKARDIEEISIKLTPYQVVAPIDGIWEPHAEVGQQVKKGDSVANIVSENRPRVSFQVPDSKDVIGSHVTVRSAKEAEISAQCEVVAVQTPTVTVACPLHSGLPEGGPVLLVR